MLTFPARVPGLNDSLVTFPALAIAVGEGQMRTVSAMDFGLGPVDRLSALPAEVGLALIGVILRSSWASRIAFYAQGPGVYTPGFWTRLG